MSSQVQFRRGTTTQNNAFTGAAGEISVDSTLNVLRLHDGTTSGGNAILSAVAAQTALNKTFSTGSYWQGSPVALAYGGTGSNITANAGSVAYSTSSGLGLTASGTSGQILVSGGIGAPTWVAASSISAGTSTLATTATNIAGGSAGQLIIQADTSLSTFITAGASGTFLKSAGAGYAPTWATGQITIGSTSTSLGNTSTSLAGLDVLSATGTSNWLIPVGTTAQRPGTPSSGMIRYNTDQVSFEGYSSGAWSSLGGVSSVNKYTYIRAETSAGAANGDLDFFAQNAGVTAAQQVGQWNRTNLKDYTGTLVGTQTTQSVFDTTATTVNAFGAATTLTLGNATSATLTLRPGTVVGSNTTQTLYNTVATTVNAFGAATAITLGNATSATLTVNPGTVVGANTTQTLFNTVATTINAFGASTATTLGAATGTFTVNSVTLAHPNATTFTMNGASPSITTTSTGTASVFNTNALTGALFGAATAVSIGASTGTLTLANPTITATNATSLALNGASPAITTTSTTASVFNATVTTLNIGGAATALNLGATTGTTTVNNNMVVSGNLTVSGTTTTINSTTVSVADINIELGKTASPTNATADGGGITLHGTTDKTFNWVNATSGWTSSEHIALAAGKTLIFGGSTSGTTTLIASSTASGTLILPAASDTLVGKATTDTLTNKTFNTAGTGNSFSINSNAITGYTGTGAVVALSASPTFTGTLNAAVIAATGDITSPNFYSVSDERLKSNIQDSSYGLAEVMKLRSVQYDMDGRHEVGLLAQNVEEHMSEFVTTDTNGIKKLDYAKMISVLVKTVQQQQEQIEILKSKLG
jgi:hypothetical protein